MVKLTPEELKRAVELNNKKCCECSLEEIRELLKLNEKIING